MGRGCLKGTVMPGGLNQVLSEDYTSDRQVISADEMPFLCEGGRVVLS